MYNNKFNNRSTLYNTAGQFVSAGELAAQQYAPARPPIPNLQPAQPTFSEEMKPEFKPLESADTDMTSTQEARPAWMKPKLAGVKKVSNRERRRRQNQTLRRLLTPKNALMVLNEMMPGEQLNSQFRVEQTAPTQPYFANARNATHYCADLTLHGGQYKGYGENKMSARNSAAEQAIRDLVIKKMQKLAQDGDGQSTSGEEEDDPLPMIQLASYALHKLFTEWECEGHKVPSLRPATAEAEARAETRAEARAGGAAKVRALPPQAAAMHPCMVLTHMRPGLEYRVAAAAGDRPQNRRFTMAVDVDGVTYLGSASNKKEARKQAAKAACAAVFNLTFDEDVKQQ